MELKNNISTNFAILRKTLYYFFYLMILSNIINSLKSQDIIKERSFKFEIKVINQTISFVKIPLLIVVFFMWIYFLERAGFILTSLIAFNLLILVNSGLNAGIKKIALYMIFGSIFVLLLYFGFKNLLLVPLPEGLWFRDI